MHLSKSSFPSVQNPYFHSNFNHLFRIFIFSSSPKLQKHPHVIFEARTKQNKGCAVSSSFERRMGIRRQKHISGFRPDEIDEQHGGSRSKRDVREATKYIETALIIDRAMFEKRNGSTRAEVVHDAIQVANIADLVSWAPFFFAWKFYRNCISRWIGWNGTGGWRKQVNFTGNGNGNGDQKSQMPFDFTMTFGKFSQIGHKFIIMNYDFPMNVFNFCLKLRKLPIFDDISSNRPYLYIVWWISVTFFSLAEFTMHLHSKTPKYAAQRTGLTEPAKSSRLQMSF